MKSSQKEKTDYEQAYFLDTSALIKLYHQEEGTVITPLSGMVARKAMGLIKVHGDTRAIRTLRI